MLNILYVSQFFYPEITAGAFRAYENSYYWTKEDHNVSLLTTYPNYPKGKIFDGYKNKLIDNENIDGINVIRVKSIIRKNTNKINRLILYISFLVYSFLNTLLGKIKIKQYDIIIGSSGPIFAPIYGYVISKLFRIPFVLELRDITFIQMLGTFSDSKSFYYKTIKWLELFLCKKASLVVVTTESFKNILNNYGINEEKIHVIPNGVSLNLKKQNKNLKEKVDTKELVFCYAGTFGISQDLIELIRFFNGIKIEGKKLYLIGDGAEKDKIIKYVSNNKLEDVIILDPMPKHKLEEFYKNVDICCVKLKNTKEFSNFIPSKIFDIMKNKKPVLYLGPKGEVTNIIEKSNCGFYYNDNVLGEAKKFEQFIDKVEDKKQFKIKLKKLGNNGYNYCIENHDRKKLAKKYLTLLEELVYER